MLKSDVRSRLRAVSRSAHVAGAGFPAPAVTGAPALLYSWDPDNTSLVTLNAAKTNIAQLAGADGTALALANGSNTGPTRVLVNGRYAAQFLGTASQFLSAAGGQSGGTQVVIFDNAGAALSMTNGIFGEVNSTAATTFNRQEILKINTAGAYVTARRSDTSGGNADASSGAGNDTNIHIAISTNPSGVNNCYLFFDGAGTPVQSGSTADLPTGIDTVIAGARMVSGSMIQFHTGNIYRILKYPSILTNPQIEEIAVWAAANFGTPNLA